MQKNDIDKFERLCYNDYVRYKRKCALFNLYKKAKQNLCKNRTSFKSKDNIFRKRNFLREEYICPIILLSI